MAKQVAAASSEASEVEPQDPPHVAGAHPCRWGMVDSWIPRDRLRSYRRNHFVTVPLVTLLTAPFISSQCLCDDMEDPWAARQSVRLR